MRWIKERVEAIAQLRCIEANGDFPVPAAMVSSSVTLARPWLLSTWRLRSHHNSTSRPGRS